MELSTAQVYAPPKKGRNDEAGKIEPWTRLAKFKFDCEEYFFFFLSKKFVLFYFFCFRFLKKSGLNVTILRASTVYGPGDTSGLCLFPPVD